MTGETCPRCGAPSASPPAEVYCVECATTTWRPCPRCKGKGTVVKNGPHPDEYDSAWPCPDCTTDRTALRGSGRAA